MNNAFRGDRAFLSNMYSVSLYWNGRLFPSSESAYQAEKCPQFADKICSMSGRDAKSFTRSIPARPDWEKVNVGIMHGILRAKFSQNERLAKKLMSTGDEVLCENNTWGDTFWGVCNGVGENMLGRLLMQVRNELHNGVLPILPEKERNLVFAYLSGLSNMELADINECLKFSFETDQIPADSYYTLLRILNNIKE